MPGAHYTNQCSYSTRGVGRTLDVRPSSGLLLRNMFHGRRGAPTLPAAAHAQKAPANFRQGVGTPRRRRPRRSPLFHLRSGGAAAAMLWLLELGAWDLADPFVIQPSALIRHSSLVIRH